MKQKDTLRNQYLASIVNSLNIDLDQFLMKVAKKYNYEYTIYVWSITLFKKDIPAKEATKIVLEKLRKKSLNLI